MAERWSEMRELGFLSGMRFLFWVYRLGGYIAFKVVLQPVLLYYFLVNRTAREASRDFLQRLYFSGDGSTPTASFYNSYRHFNAFARSSLDRLGVWANGSILDRISFPSRPLLLEQIEKGEGGILMGAHLGNMEICRGLSTRNPGLKLNILVHTHNADMFNRLLREVVGDDSISLIEVSELGPATAMHLSDRIARGEFVAVLADRVPVSSQGRSHGIAFLGAEAQFPDGPFILASLMKCPVYTLFCARVGDGYEIHCEKLADSVSLPRNNRDEALLGYMRCYVAVLEKNVRRYPLQWFNFYPFWDQA